MGKLVVDVEDLDVYQLAFETQQQVFEISKSFPRDEMYSLSHERTNILTHQLMNSTFRATMIA